MICGACGSSDFTWKGSKRICSYCRTSFTTNSIDGKPVRDAEIGVVDDVSRLLQKCRDDPRNAIKYANLILDVDPTNKEALSYL